MNTGESLCPDCGHEMCVCADDTPLTYYIPLPPTVTFYISVVRYGIAGWGPGPCGTDLAYIQSALLVYANIDACRIYPVQLPMPTVPTA